MKPPPSLHSNFFSSLKQVEKRLKVEHPLEPSTPPSPLPPPSLPLITESNSLAASESLSSPLYLHTDHLSDQRNSISTTLQESSEPPPAFLSQFSPTHENPPQPATTQVDHHPKTINKPEVDDMQNLIHLLGLSDPEEKVEVRDGRECSGCNSCHCEDGFYSKIVGVRGPKCRKEMERLDGWIKYLLNAGGGKDRIEPVRLSLLLLGKAAAVSEAADFGGLEFPSAIQDFLLNDPPTT